jgi:hypothetical protein
MIPDMSVHLLPVSVFMFEPVEARELVWLPLAVRFKLDEARLRLRLSEWQALSIRERTSLLVCPGGETFRTALLSLVPAVAAVHQARSPQRIRGAFPAEGPPDFAQAGDLAPLLRGWWAGATRFERYLVVKILQSFSPVHMQKVLEAVMRRDASIVADTHHTGDHFTP